MTCRSHVAATAQFVCVLTLRSCRDGIKQIVIAASNTWGLLMLVVMLGYGLVDVPRWLWHRYHREFTLKMFQVGL